MKLHARGLLIMMIVGMLMIVGGVFYFISNVKLTSNFFLPDENWPLWATILSLVPLAGGIIWMAIQPKKWYPRVLGLAGAVLAIVMISYHTTLHLKTHWSVGQWILVGGLLIGGLALVLVALFSRKKESHE